ncbi:hypothetical protein BTHERMOSOX_1284 [Bathymodiolus thermophilus thioautotrophic gill symbiont]|nr:hypothetical protein BTHERMOSOX_1284 [Bathymodiolus thermophilus thioautotrophic gill symbiont]
MGGSVYWVLSVKNKQSLFEDSEQKVEKYLTYLAIEQKSTQNQAFKMLWCFLYTKV